MQIFNGKLYSKSALSPRTFDYGPGPGSGLSPSLNVGPRHIIYLYQCTILAADFVIFYYGIKNDQAIQAGAGSE